MLNIHYLFFSEVQGENAQKSQRIAYKWNMEFLLCAASTFVTVLYCLVYSILYCFNSVVRKLLYRSAGPDEKVQIGRVIWRRKFHVFEYTSARDFLCFYLSNVDVDYVLRPTVSLYSIGKDEAVFVEIADGIDIYSSDENPFFHMAQFNRSKYAIKMPLKIFHAFAKKIGDPTMPVIWVSHTGRCGSTLLGQMFEKISGTQLIAEPDAPTNIVYMEKMKEISDCERVELIRSTVRFLCKPYPGTERIVIKTRPICAPQMMDVSNLFPNIKQIFLYRNCGGTVSSYLALFSSVPYTEIARLWFDSILFNATKPVLRKQFELYFLGKPTTMNIMRPSSFSSTTELLTFMWANYIFLARDAMSLDQTILPIKYDDFTRDKENVCGKVLQKLGLNLKYLDAVVTAFDSDSQRGTIVSQSLIGNTPRRLISETDRTRADHILASYDLPAMNEDFRI